MAIENIVIIILTCLTKKSGIHRILRPIMAIFRNISSLSFPELYNYVIDLLD